MSVAAPPVDLRPDHLGIVRDILHRRVPDRKVMAFGSRATWTAGEHSDLDLAILGAEPLPLSVTAALAEDFSESELPFKVDLVDWTRLDESFRGIIRRHQVAVQIPARRPERLAVASGWQRGALGDYLALVRDTVSPSSVGDVPYIGLKHVARNTLSPLGVGRSRDVKGTKLRFKKGDILFGRARPYLRRVARPSFDGICSTDFWVIRSRNDGVDQGFLFRLLSSEPVIRLAASSSKGAHAPRANWDSLSQCETAMPPLPEQRAIARFLGTLDDKIESNRRTNETLEAIARTVFRDWFVGFGPTRAKMEGRAPYLADEIWDLFPDTLDEDGQPEGWETSEIGREVEFAGGATPGTSERLHRKRGGHRWATPKDLSDLTSPVLLDTARRVTGAGARRADSAVLPVGTVLLSSRAPIGHLAVTEIPTAVNQGVIAMTCEGRLHNLFVLFWCHENLAHIKAAAGGSASAEVSKRAFRLAPVTVPSVQVLAAYERAVRPIYTGIVANAKESRLLAATRDLLLPKLVSGEVAVDRAEDMAEAAT